MGLGGAREHFAGSVLTLKSLHKGSNSAKLPFGENRGLISWGGPGSLLGTSWEPLDAKPPGTLRSSRIYMNFYIFAYIYA